MNDIELSEEMILPPRRPRKALPWVIIFILFSLGAYLGPKALDYSGRLVDRALLWAIDYRLGGVDFEISDKTKKVVIRGSSDQATALYYTAVAYQTCDRTLRDFSQFLREYQEAEDKDQVVAILRKD